MAVSLGAQRVKIIFLVLCKLMHGVDSDLAIHEVQMHIPVG